jgi:aspartyl protease family protein
MPLNEERGVIRLLLIALMVAGTAGTVMAYGDPHRLAQARDLFPELLIRARGPQPRIVEIPRTAGGEFTLHASINGVNAPMLVDTGATSVVLTYETAKAAGLPLEMLDYGVPVETVNGRARAARLTLDRIAIGGLVERAVPALVVPPGQMATNLLGMSFLDRLESWEMRADRFRMHGYP